MFKGKKSKNIAFLLLFSSVLNLGLGSLSVSADEVKTTDSSKKEDNKKEDTKKADAKLIKDNKDIEEYNKKLNKNLESYYKIRSQQYSANNQVEKLINEIDGIKGKIDKEDKKLSESKEELEKVNKRLKENKGYLNKIARESQVSSKEDSILDTLFGSKKTSDKITETLAKSKLLDAQDERIKDIQKDKDLKDNLLKTIESNKKSLTEQKENLEKTQKELEANKKVLSQEDKVAVLKESKEKVVEIRKDVEETTKKLKTEAESDKNNKGLQELYKSYKTASEDMSDKGITIDGKKYDEDNIRDQIVLEAMKHIGKPYVWGGKGADVFDCSGFTSYVYRHAVGIEIGGWTVPQESSGTQVPVDKAEVGDLLFWGSVGGTHHVGIYIGDGKYIHAPQPGETIKVANVYNSYFTPDFAVKVLK